MNKRLPVRDLALSAVLLALAACSSPGATSVPGAVLAPAPVEMEVVQAPTAQSPAVHNELLDPEFGCSGGGSLEYGVVQRPRKN